MRRKHILLSVLFLAFLFSFIKLGGIVYSNFVPNTATVAVFDEEKINLVLEGGYVYSRHSPKVVDGEVLLPFDLVRDKFDKNIFWDEKLQKLTVTTRDKLIRMNTDNLTAMVNNKPVSLKIPVKSESNVIYVPIQFLSELYGIEVKYVQDTNTVVIDRKKDRIQIARAIVPEAVIRRGRSIREPIVKKVGVSMEQGQEAEELQIYEEYDKWYKVLSSDGIPGYIEKRFVAAVWDVSKQEQAPQKNETVWKPENGKINLVWEGIWSDKGIDTSKIQRMNGVDVVSPTWFEVVKEDGTIISRAESRYMEWAGKNGYKVWALFANNFKDPAMTHKTLADSNVRDNMIRQILVYAQLYKLDGINIDFENVNKADKDLLTQFVRELTPLLREQGLVVSMDVTVPDGSDNWSLCYDRKAIGETVDYVMLMTYDQHWGTSPKSGSVAQITWVEKYLKRTLEMIPPEKLLLGLPFYTREWKEVTEPDGKVKVTSSVLSMSAVQKRIRDENLIPVWDEVSGQYYTEYRKEGILYKIWIEDTNSINRKSSLVHKYQLAGACSWMRGNEVPEIWDVLADSLKNRQNYQQWALDNTERRQVFR